MRLVNTWKTGFVKSLVDNLVVTCDEFENTPENSVINPSNGINYWLLAVVILAITCILGTQRCEVLHETWINNFILVIMLSSRWMV